MENTTGLVVMIGIGLSLSLGLLITGLVLLRGLKQGVVGPIDRITDNLDGISQIFPSAKILESMRRTGDDLGASLTAQEHALQVHNRVLVALPNQISDTVAERVAQGLSPIEHELQTLTTTTANNISELSAEISQTHQHLINALRTVDSAGGLSEWTTSFREAVEPLQATTAQLEQHFTLVDHLLDNAGQLAAEVARVREAAEQSLGRITEAVVHWESIEAAGIRNLREEMVQRLDALQAAMISVSEAISPLQVGLDSLRSSTELTQDAVLGSVRQMEHLQTGARQLVDEHRNLQASQRRFQEDMREFQSGVEGHGQRFANELELMTKSMAKFRGEHSEILAAMERQRQEMQQSQARSQRELSDLLTRTGKQLQQQLSQLPTRRGQLVTNMVLSVQLGIIAVLIMFALMHG